MQQKPSRFGNPQRPKPRGKSTRDVRPAGPVGRASVADGVGPALCPRPVVAAPRHFLGAARNSAGAPWVRAGLGSGRAVLLVAGHSETPALVGDQVSDSQNPASRDENPVALVAARSAGKKYREAAAENRRAVALAGEHRVVTAAVEQDSTDNIAAGNNTRACIEHRAVASNIAHIRAANRSRYTPPALRRPSSCSRSDSSRRGNRRSPPVRPELPEWRDTTPVS